MLSRVFFFYGERMNTRGIKSRFPCVTSRMKVTILLFSSSSLRKRNMNFTSVKIYICTRRYIFLFLTQYLQLILFGVFTFIFLGRDFSFLFFSFKYIFCDMSYFYFYLYSFSFLFKSIFIHYFHQIFFSIQLICVIFLQFLSSSLLFIFLVKYSSLLSVPFAFLSSPFVPFPD